MFQSLVKIFPDKQNIYTNARILVTRHSKIFHFQYRVTSDGASIERVSRGYRGAIEISIRSHFPRTERARMSGTVEEKEDFLADFADQGENIRLSEFETVEIDDPEPARKRGRRSVPGNFEELQWSKNANAFTGYEFDLPTGPSSVMSAEKGAVDFFLLLMDNHMVSQIVNETNRYARQSLQGQGKDPSEWDNKEVTPAEMKAWLGLIMAMSIHKLPAIVDYWKDDWILVYLPLPALCQEPGFRKS